MKKSKLQECVISVFSIILVLGGYAYLMHNRTMPLAEGWYTYYAQLINNGSIVYKDFEYLFTPIYIYLIAAFTDVFGYEIIKLRLLGVVIFVVIGLGLYATFRIIFDDWIACISAIVAALYMQTEVVQVFYDYVRVMDIFSVFTGCFLILTIKALMNGQDYRYYAFLCGIFCSIFILIKQNMGLIYFAYALLVILFSCRYLVKFDKTIFKVTGYMLVGLCIPIISTLFLLQSNGALEFFFASAGGSAIAAKGGMFTILFGWLINNLKSFGDGILKTPIVIVFFGLLMFLAHNGKIINRENLLEKELQIRINKEISNIDSYKMQTICKIVFVLTIYFLTTQMSKNIFFANIALASVNEGYNFSPYFLFVICITIFFFLGYILLKDIKHENNAHKKYLLIFVLLGSYIAISYGCGTSGGLAEGQAPLGMGFLVASSLYFAKGKYETIKKIILVLVCALFALHSVAFKMTFPYNWWGMKEAPYWVSYAPIEKGVLKDILVSKNTKEMYESIYSIVRENTTENDKIFVFPQIPIFYSFLERFDPGTFSKVQWFDVSNENTLDSDMETIIKNKPNFIIMYNLDENVYSAHEKFFRGGKISGTQKMRNKLLEFAQENYILVNEYDSYDDTISLWQIKQNDKKEK